LTSSIADSPRLAPPTSGKTTSKTTGKAIDSFDLLETLRWAPVEGFALLERHLQRLRGSAEHFAYPCPLDRIRDALNRAVLGADGLLRVRLLLDRQGEPRVESSPLLPLPVPLRVRLADSPIDSTDELFFHKTTSRQRYERHRSISHDETVLWNPAREVTEAITFNVVVELEGRRVTPPVGCGLLPGTLRAELLARGELLEGHVTVDELIGAPRLWLINSVRGWQEAVLDPSRRPA
jgi:para-aminobenzoate synthetase/4-amino-4-deoxychorismate lyase